MSKCRSTTLLACLGALLLWPAIDVRQCVAGEITQYFPAAAAGETAPRPESGWRIKYEILAAGTHNYGGSAVWEFQSVEFMRGYKPSGEEDWIKILNNLVLAEMYVPYYNGMEIWDITGYFFNFVRAKVNYIPHQGIISGRLLADNVVIAEVVDDNVRWMATNDNIRRGQVLELWATLNAANYRYVIKYSFADDGTIHVRAGGTARNLRSVPVGDEEGMHLHSPGWRLEFDLGAADANKIEIVEREPDPQSARATLVHRPFANGSEGGEIWNPEKFTTVMVTNARTMDRHDPAHNVSYKLVSLRSGSPRTFREHTKYDFWAVLSSPSEPNRSSDRERRFAEIADYARNPEPLDGHAVALWTATALHHIPRTEDFGAKDYNASEGSAIMMWTGFDLMPHNLWDKTPLFAGN
jgi:hypothetical protein